MRDWFRRRQAKPLATTLAELLAELHDQHFRVAVEKVSVSDYRDPFCIADDEGLMRVVRLDDPFWTGARFDVVNHLLWTLGLLTSPSGDVRLEPLGERMLNQMANA